MSSKMQSNFIYKIKSVYFVDHSFFVYTPVKMSFWDIPDPIERERVVRDYERIKPEIQERQDK